MKFLDLNNMEKNKISFHKFLFILLLKFKKVFKQVIIQLNIRKKTS